MSNGQKKTRPCMPLPRPGRTPWSTPIAAVASVATAVAGISAASADEVDTAPHRAVYEITLDEARGAMGVTDITGQLVFEIEGSACQGYTVNRRFVSRVSGDEVNTTSDQQLTTFEEADGSVYRFVTRSYFDDSLSETTDGVATREDGGVVVRLTEPDEGEFQLGSDVLFPFQHIHRLLEAAAAGETMFAAEVYEGTDTGRTVYETTALIGDRQERGELPDVAGAEGLDGVDSWPVSIAYFKPSNDEPAETPTYEFTYDLYANGVSTRMHLDYEDFALNGKLVSLEFLEPAPCE